MAKKKTEEAKEQVININGKDYNASDLNRPTKGDG